ncbi:MAG: hypothetical protein V2I26_08445, partial [Halieaceae bacterium]|nr:hypothetical protein [Halieaceae bacterium]
MPTTRKALLPLAVLCASYMADASAATDAERIQALEAQLNQQKAAMEQQQRMLEAMTAELQRLKAGEAAPAAPEQEVFGAPAVASTPAPAESTKPRASANVYGFVMADTIYDFKRVDPDWQDTLRVTTIPTQSGAYGNDGDFIFSVRQSRLGVQGNYGEDITYKLEGELFGVGSDQGQTTLRVRHAWATYKNFGMG